MKITFSDYTVELKLTSQLKTRIKILVAKAYNLNKKIATTATIKKLFPNWDLRKASSWFGVMAECLEKIDREEKPVWKIIQEKIKELGLLSGECDSLAGFSYPVSHKSNEGIRKVGTLGFSKIHNAFFFGSRARNFYFPSLDDAVEMMLIHSGLNRVAA
jgi:hypothetical protein